MQALGVMLIIGSSLALASCEHASVNQPILAHEVEHTFLALDADRSGAISKAEANAAPLLARNFAQADMDGDGALDRYEFNSPGWQGYPGEPD